MTGCRRAGGRARAGGGRGRRGARPGRTGGRSRRPAARSGRAGARSAGGAAAFRGRRAGGGGGRATGGRRRDSHPEQRRVRIPSACRARCLVPRRGDRDLVLLAGGGAWVDVHARRKPAAGQGGRRRPQYERRAEHRSDGPGAPRPHELSDLGQAHLPGWPPVSITRGRWDQGHELSRRTSWPRQSRAGEPRGRPAASR